MAENTEAKKYIFGVDIGGTACKMGLFDDSGLLLERWQIPTDKSGDGMKVFSHIRDCVYEKLSDHGIDKAQVMGIGVGVPASVTGKGIIQKCPALGWSSLDIPKTVTEATGLPSLCGNDANLAAAGEAWKGFNRSYSDAVFVTLGTGVGGGIICGGRVLQGAHGCSGELGHIKVNPAETRRDGCGGYGCLQQYASATGIVSLAEQVLIEKGEKSAGGYLWGRKKFSAKDVFDGARLGDEVCLETVEGFGEILGRALAGICLVFDPEAVIIGGGVSAAGDIVIESVQRGYRKWAFPPAENMEFRLASLGNDAGIYGCAKMVLDQFL